MRAWVVVCVFVGAAVAAAQPVAFRVRDGGAAPRVIFKVGMSIRLLNQPSR